MRKILKACTVLVLACVMILGLSTSVSAAGSKTAEIEIIKAVSGGSDITPEIGESTANPHLTAKIASEVLAANGIASTENLLTVLWEKNVTASATPVTLTFKVSGTAGKTVYVFHWNGTAWEYITKGTGDTVEAEFSNLSPVGLVLQLEDGTQNPDTGDHTNIVLWAGILVLAAAGATGTILYGKKRKNEA